jgi:multidrug efflux pump subunit AcrB
VSDRLQLLVINGMQGLALVFLTMWLFFSFRFSFWVTMGLPVSFLGAIFIIQVGSESYKIDVQLAFQDKNSLADLEYFHITTDEGKQVPLAAVATLDTGRGFARISRINSRRTVTIRGDVDTKVANTNEIIPWQALSSTILSSS